MARSSSTTGCGVSAEPTLRAARPDDWPHVEALLRACALPVDGAAEHFADFVVADVAGRVVAVAGIEAHGDDGLLRSVAVQYLVTSDSADKPNGSTIAAV